MTMHGKKKLSRLSIFLIVFAAILFFAPKNAYAAVNIGLIPCGRLVDNVATVDIDETKPCTVCAMFYLLKNAINFIITLAIGVGVFILVIAGFLYAFSAGDNRKIDQAKSAITSALIGIAIIFSAWLVIAVTLQGMGYANMSTWNQVNCAL